MIPTKDRLKHHAALFDRLAGQLGLDLQRSAIEGDLRFGEIADAVLRCVDCPDPAHCAARLDDHTAVAGDPPGYCRNRDLLNRLRAT